MARPRARASSAKPYPRRHTPYLEPPYLEPPCLELPRLLPHPLQRQLPPVHRTGDILLSYSEYPRLPAHLGADPPDGVRHPVAALPGEGQG
ncbi:hypothetical protein [Streptomyces sp. ST1015]|uniref:hypothetical protein n=1 Tax=Streptomyces sp. ST1015 TaxID=1848900 RepID=UPI0039775B34